MAGTVDNLYELYSGLQRAHGEYVLSGEKSTKGKAKGKANTVHTPATKALWAKHIGGQIGLGIIPIRDDGTCLFAIIDVDRYDVDLNVLENQVEELNLPFIVIRSKSGGAHITVYFDEPADCEQVRQKMAEISVVLGFPGVEIFPKQSQLADGGDVGNWINMPYLDATRTVRYALKNGEALDVDEFIAYAIDKKVTLDNFLAVPLPMGDAFEDGPPCLQHLAQAGFPDGSMNNALFSCGVYARKRYGDQEFEKYVWEYNTKYMHGNQNEVKALIKAIGKKEYFFLCEQPPLKEHCNKTICRTRKYGIGCDSMDPGVVIDSITKIDTDPPSWIVSISGIRISMVTQELTNQTLFGNRVLDKITRYPTKLTARRWGSLINKLCSEAEILEAPNDASLEGQFWWFVEEFCTGRALALNAGELLLGKPWTEEKTTYFRSSDLAKYLEQQRFPLRRVNEIWGILRMRDSTGHRKFHVKGKCVATWSVPEFIIQDEEFDIPRIPIEDF